MRLPGVAFIIVGAAMALMSFLIEWDREEKKLLFFVVVGIGLIVYGAAKMVFFRKDLRTAKAKGISLKPETVKKHPEKLSKKIPHETHELRCVSCGVKLHPLFEFCPKCGHRAKGKR